MQANDLQTLARMLARQASSLLQYLRGAWPWTPAGEQPILERLGAIQTEESAALRDLVNFLLKNRGTPTGPVFPEEFTTLHFVGLDHLLPRLVAFQRWLVQGAEADLANLTDPAARTVGEKLVAMNRRHLAELEQLHGRHSQAHAKSTLR